MALIPTYESRGRVSGGGAIAPEPASDLYNLSQVAGERMAVELEKTRRIEDQMFVANKSAELVRLSEKIREDMQREQVPFEAWGPEYRNRYNDQVSALSRELTNPTLRNLMMNTVNEVGLRYEANLFEQSMKLKKDAQLTEFEGNFDALQRARANATGADRALFDEQIETMLGSAQVSGLLAASDVDKLRENVQVNDINSAIVSGNLGAAQQLLDKSSLPLDKVNAIKDQIRARGKQFQNEAFQETLLDIQTGGDYTVEKINSMPLRAAQKRTAINLLNSVQKERAEIAAALGAFETTDLLDQGSAPHRKAATAKVGQMMAETGVSYEQAVSDVFLEKGIVEPRYLDQINSIMSNPSASPKQIVEAADKIDQLRGVGALRGDDASVMSKPFLDSRSSDLYYAYKSNLEAGLEPGQAATQAKEMLSLPSEKRREIESQAVDAFEGEAYSLDKIDFRSGALRLLSPLLVPESLRQAFRSNPVSQDMEYDYKRAWVANYKALGGDASATNKKTRDQMRSMYSFSSESGAEQLTKYPLEQFYKQYGLGESEIKSQFTAAVARDLGDVDAVLVSDQLTENQIKSNQLVTKAIKIKQSDGRMVDAIDPVTGYQLRFMPDISGVIARQEKTAMAMENINQRPANWSDENIPQARTLATIGGLISAQFAPEAFISDAQSRQAQQVEADALSAIGANPRPRVPSPPTGR